MKSRIVALSCRPHWIGSSVVPLLLSPVEPLLLVEAESSPVVLVLSPVELVESPTVVVPSVSLAGEPFFRRRLPLASTQIA